MAVALGKRKRRSDIKENITTQRDGDSQSESESDMRMRFQRAFEARFKPLSAIEKPANTEELSEDDGSNSSGGSDWSGLSDEEDERIETVEHAMAQQRDEEQERLEKKAFMSSKPPSSHVKAALPGLGLIDSVEDEDTDATNLKHDLALQRLLKEAHLLDPNAAPGSNTAPEGKGRLKALDMRLQDLGAKDSHLKQDKMPLAHRKGMQAKSATREQMRRKDAAENGVILERARAGVVPKTKARRERSVGGPTVGKFTGGTLRLSSRDVRSIQDSSSGGQGTKGRRKR